jgi:hypothetical protein
MGVISSYGADHERCNPGYDIDTVGTGKTATLPYALRVQLQQV